MAIQTLAFTVKPMNKQKIAASFERLTCGCGGMADTPALGAGGGNPVEVQVLSSAPGNYFS
jgi:hypothetical protein